MSEWMNERKNEWMNEWMNECMYTRTPISNRPHRIPCINVHVPIGVADQAERLDSFDSLGDLDHCLMSLRAPFKLGETVVGTGVSTESLERIDVFTCLYVLLDLYVSGQWIMNCSLIPCVYRENLWAYLVLKRSSRGLPDKTPRGDFLGFEPQGLGPKGSGEALVNCNPH